jgi:hypothetical protein
MPSQKALKLLAGRNAHRMRLNEDERKKDDDYLRVLDGFARFYNSQITAHAGYMLATGIGVFTALIAIIMNSDKILDFLGPRGIPWYWSIPIIVAPFAVYFFLIHRLPSPFCWISSIYHYARLQYYIAISEVVLSHLPHTSTNATGSYYNALKKRAIEPYDLAGNGLGISAAISHFFEARLYASCQRKKNHQEGYQLDITEQDLFHLSDWYARGFIFHGLYEGEKRLRRWIIWSQADLLLLAYRDTLRRYRNDKPESYNGQVWRLFQQFVDC